ncbi:cytochrome b-c1 complex subunit 9 [Nylanderia fulva]|uniref:cytochrome b-c1 complex subunit 9 n=1 Tax=Nylanderia fulva TaxID=613905 RepID=UPI0010FB503B|nr:cytochrome b-c1 complex subunit 9 [Nylanderia fulva]
MGIGGTLYNVVLRRTSTFTLVVLASAFVFERSFDVAADKIFETINKGKLWKDIKHRYE